MHRRSASSTSGQSVSHSVSSSVGPQPSRSESLPLVPCPECGVTVKKLVSRTELNPGRVFYKCTNQDTRCKFWMWENDYERYCIKVQLENLMDEFKRKSDSDEEQIKVLVASMDKIKLYNCISSIVIVTLLIVVIILLK